MLTGQQKYRMKDFSSVFSRGIIQDVVKFGDCTRLNDYAAAYSRPSANSYLDFIIQAYSELKRSYRCEYVFKNELLRRLLNHYRGANTVAFSEFRVGDAIADMVLVNGESRVFEIKTEYDTPKRLEGQLCEYSKVFDKCFLVVPKEKADEYSKIVSEETGIIAVSFERGRVCMDQEYRPATKNTEIDVSVLMRTLRTPEYRNIVKSFYGYLPDVTDFEMFGACEQMMSVIPSSELSVLFKREIKKRKCYFDELRGVPIPIRQTCLALNLKPQEMEQLIENLSNPINR